jgi:hypothetical protein
VPPRAVDLGRSAPVRVDTPAFADPDRLRALHDGAGLVIERDYLIGGLLVRARFAGRAMFDRVTPAITHLETTSGDIPVLVLHVWDARSTGTAAPEFPEVAPVAGGERPRYYVEQDGLRASYQPGNGMLSVLDTTGCEGWYWADDAAALPFLDAAEPLRQIFHWWLGDQGLQMLHGGGVGLPTGGVLITGKNGSGKSTTALASLASQLRYAGDDYVVVEPGAPPRLHSLYNSGKLERHHLVRFRGLLTNLPNADEIADDKAVIFAEELYPDRVITDFPLRAVIVPRVTEARAARLVEISPAVALAALAPTTLLQHHPPQPNALAAMAELVRSVPTLSLELGSDLASIPATICEFLEAAR